MQTKRGIWLLGAFLVLAFSGGMAGSHVYAETVNPHPREITIPPANKYWCDDCHLFEDGLGNPITDPTNRRWVRTSITLKHRTGTVTINYPDGSTNQVNGYPNYDGPCESCHYDTVYHCNEKEGQNCDHTHGVSPDEQCVDCHQHFQEFMFGGALIGRQSHYTHFAQSLLDEFGYDVAEDAKGPRLPSCFWGAGLQGCHTSESEPFYKFGPSPGQPIETTDVCDTCHSPGGAFNGTAEGKAKWEAGVYKENEYELNDGNENWCAGCHDRQLSIANSNSEIDGVAAPSVVGDNTTYGFYYSGHGKHNVTCTDRYCHEVSLTLRHIDGEPRTYSAALRNYKDGYRLAEDMAMPRDGGEVHPEAFALCTACHRYTDVTGDYTTGFREDEEEPYAPRNMHKKHLEEFRFYIVSDSDFSANPDGDNCSSGLCLDSAPTCTNCHNIHGSKTPSMIRSGELISTPGTENKTPALDFRWLKADFTLTTVRERSAYGRMKVSPTRPNASINYVCTGCHGGVYPPTYQTSYFREMGVQVRDIWTTDLSNNYKTAFSPNAPIRYHLSFKLGGLMVSYQVAVGQSGAGNTPSMPGNDWTTPLSATGPRIPGTYEITWDKTIPGTATPGSSAAFRIRMGLFDSPGGTLLNTDEMTKYFSIVP